MWLTSRQRMLPPPQCYKIPSQLWPLRKKFPVLLTGFSTVSARSLWLCCRMRSAKPLRTKQWTILPQCPLVQLKPGGAIHSALVFHHNTASTNTLLNSVWGSRGMSHTDPSSRRWNKHMNGLHCNCIVILHRVHADKTHLELAHHHTALKSVIKEVA